MSTSAPPPSSSSSSSFVSYGVRSTIGGQSSAAAPGSAPGSAIKGALSQHRHVGDGGGGGGQKDKELLEQLRAMQQMEKETKETLASFLSKMNERTTTQDYSALLLEKVDELRRSEQEVDVKSQEIVQLQTQVSSLLERQEVAVATQARHVDDQLKAQSALSDADKTIRKLESQLQLQHRNHHQDLEHKSSVLRSLEDECTTSKAECASMQRNLEASETERIELHKAMSSLHGEITVLQLELDDWKERENEIIRQRKELLHRLEGKEEDIIRLRSDKGTLESRVSDLERKIADVSDLNAMIEHEAGTKVDTLQRERDSVHGSLAKMSFKIKQQGQTQHDLNSLLNKMRPQLADAIEKQHGAESRHAEAVAQVNELRAAMAVLESDRREAETLLVRSQTEARGLASDVTQLKERNSELLSENRKASNRIDRLEKDKLDMALDVSGKARDIDVLKQNFDLSQITIEELRAKIDSERASKERALEQNGILDSELERHRSDNREHQENIDSLSRQLRECDRMREQALDVSRAQQRENANRIVDFSQKNAKLSSEVTSLQEEISHTKRTKEEAIRDLRGCEKERDEAKMSFSSTRSRLQILEDQYEEASAKLESRKAEMDELRLEIRREAQVRDAALASARQEHEAAIIALTKRMTDEAEEKWTAESKVHSQNASSLEKALQKAKEMHSHALEEIESQRQRDASDAKSKVATVAKAMEILQSELRDESNKNKILHQELSVLKDLAEVGSSEAQERLHYVERERLRDRTRLEGQLADVKEQLRQHSEQKQQRDQLMATIEQQLTREREARFAAAQRVRTLEDESGSMSSQLDSMTEENGGLKKQLREHERKLSMILSAKDAELQRLTRRNEVLGEAVTRLTSMTESNSLSKPKSSLRSLSSPPTLTSAMDRFFVQTSSSALEESGGIYKHAGIHDDDETIDNQGNDTLTTSSNRPRPFSSSGNMSRQSLHSDQLGASAGSSTKTTRSMSAPPVRSSIIGGNVFAGDGARDADSDVWEVGMEVTDGVEDNIGASSGMYSDDNSTPPFSPPLAEDAATPVAAAAPCSLDLHVDPTLFSPTGSNTSPTKFPTPHGDSDNGCTPRSRRKSPMLSSQSTHEHMLVTPRRVDDDSDVCEGSGSSFINRVRSSVEKGKDQLLPYSPKQKMRSPRSTKPSSGDTSVHITSPVRLNDSQPSSSPQKIPIATKPTQPQPQQQNQKQQHQQQPILKREGAQERSLLAGKARKGTQPAASKLKK